MMTVYMVERDLKGIAMEDLAAAQKAAIATAEAMRGRAFAGALHALVFRARRRPLHVLLRGRERREVQALNDRAAFPIAA
jgi:hypothetical protein